MFIRGIVCSNDFSAPQQQTYCGQSGVMHWNNASGKVIVHNGECGHDVYPQTVGISLTQENSDALRWARMKMQEEKELSELCAKHPGLKDAKAAFDIMHLLCKSNQ